jgi:hemoglobin
MTKNLDQRSHIPGLTEPLLRAVIQTFYTRLKQDDLLGPVFTQAIGDDWTKHIQRITLFWLRVAGIRRGYRGGDFIPAHLRHLDIRADQLPRWLKLFSETCRELCPPTVAAFLIEVAEKMAENLEISFDKRAFQRDSSIDR